MIKTLRNLLKQDKERFVVPRGVQDVIPIKAIYDDGIFQVGRDKFSKTYKFSDINYAVASREDKEAMFLEYSELLNSLDSGATTKITINNRRLNRANFEKTILLPLKGDALDEYREEYNRITVPVKKRSSASTLRKPAKKDTTSRISSARIRWSSQATISRLESVMAECCFCESMPPISRTVW